MLPCILQGKFKMPTHFSVKKMSSKPSTQLHAEDEDSWTWVSRFNCFPFFHIFIFSFSAILKRETGNSPGLPGEKQEAVAWPLALLCLAELQVLLCAELAASEPWPAAACAAGAAEPGWSGSGTWRAGWELSCLGAASLLPLQGSWAYVVEFPYLQLLKNLFEPKEIKSILWYGS